MENYNLRNKTDIKMHNVLFATTSVKDYAMSRLILLEDMPNTNYSEFVLVEGYHCSCYDFDETIWECTKLTKEELNKLLENVEYKRESDSESLRKELKDFLERYWKWNY